MYYEIYFEPGVGKWRIRLTTVWFLFFPVSKIVQREHRAGAEVGPAEYATYPEAESYIQFVGLDTVYPQLERGRSYTTSLHVGKAAG